MLTGRDRSDRRHTTTATAVDHLISESLRSSHTASTNRELHGQRDVDHVRKLRLGPRTLGPIVTPPFDGPFGRTFALADPDGYVITVHD